MAELSLIKSPHTFYRWLPGLLLTGAIAAGATLSGDIPQIARLGLGALTLAIMLGIIIGNTLFPLQQINHACHAGVLFAKHYLLRLGIILYGFRLTFQQITDVGISGLVIDLLTLSGTFYLACFLGQRLLGLDKKTVWLIGAGSSICGAAAVLATEPVIKAESSKVAVAVATVVIFGTIGIFVYPLIWHGLYSIWPDISEKAFGIYTGSTMHEVAQVVAASHAIGAESENAAVIAKMLRVMMLAPFLIVLGTLVRRSMAAADGTRTPVTFPWFALIFILVAIFNSFHLLPDRLVETINLLDNLLLAMAMAALGLTTQLGALRKAGARPMLLGLLLFIWLIIGGGAINFLVHRLIG